MNEVELQKAREHGLWNGYDYPLYKEPIGVKVKDVAILDGFLSQFRFGWPSSSYIKINDKYLFKFNFIFGNREWKLEIIEIDEEWAELEVEVTSKLNISLQFILRDAEESGWIT